MKSISPAAASVPSSVTDPLSTPPVTSGRSFVPLMVIGDLLLRGAARAVVDADRVVLRQAFAGAEVLDRGIDDLERPGDAARAVAGRRHRSASR